MARIHSRRNSVSVRPSSSALTWTCPSTKFHLQISRKRSFFYFLSTIGLQNDREKKKKRKVFGDALRFVYFSSSYSQIRRGHGDLQSWHGHFLLYPMFFRPAQYIPCVANFNIETRGARDIYHIGWESCSHTHKLCTHKYTSSPFLWGFIPYCTRRGLWPFFQIDSHC